MVEFIKRYQRWLFLVILLGGLGWLWERWTFRREHSQDKAIIAAGLRHRVHPALIKAVVWRESWFNPSAKGRSGEVGLMQIMESTASDWAAAEKLTLFTHNQLFDPGKNTECGAWYLARLLKRYARTDNPVPYALAAYNAGPGNVTRWSKGAGVTNAAIFLTQIGFPGTRDYVVAVSRRYRSYEKNFPPKGWPPR